MTVVCSCSKIEEKFSSKSVPSEADYTPSSVVLSDSLVLDTMSRAIPSDSVRLVIELFDANGSALRTPIPVTFVDDSYSEDLQCDEHGIIRRTVKKDHVVSLMYGEDVIMSYFDMKGGEELNDHIRLNILPMRGRIMDNEGVPHKKMPVHVHHRYNKKDRTTACDKDMLFYTDSLGYYKTYVSADFHSLVLHTCGFSLGAISKKEFTDYPKQNFLFDPFEVENRCAYNVPRHEFVVEVPFSETETEPIPLKDWGRFFSMDEILESSESVRVRVIFPHKTYTYKLKKRNGTYRVPVMTVCIK